MEIAVVFADVRGSTGLAEGMEPRAFAALMNRFYQVTTHVLLAHGAIIDKMVGDEVMALFIPGICGPEFRSLAAQASVALMRAIGYGENGGAWLPLGVAVHAGPAFVGNVGAVGVNDFTALGDTVNVAARLQQEARAGEVVMTEAIYQAIAAEYPDLQRREVTVRGREKPLPIRVIDFSSSP